MHHLPAAEAIVITRDDLPLTPDWIPESRDGEVRTSVKPTFDEALSLWDRDWSTWAGDDG